MISIRTIKESDNMKHSAERVITTWKHGRNNYYKSKILRWLKWKKHQA